MRFKQAEEEKKPSRKILAETPKFVEQLRKDDHPLLLVKQSRMERFGINPDEDSPYNSELAGDEFMNELEAALSEPEAN